MSIGINYLAKLEQEMERLLVRYRVAFCAWCGNSMLNESIGYIESKIGKNGARLLRDALQFAWNVAAGVKDPKWNADDLFKECNEIDWNPDEVKNEEQLANVNAVDAITCLLHTIETCRTGSHKTAAKSGERLLDNLAYQLSGKYGASSFAEVVFSDAAFVAEFDRQKKMIEYLSKGPEIGEEIQSMFRP